MCIYVYMNICLYIYVCVNVYIYTIWRRWGHVLPRNYASSKMDQANNESSSRPAVSAWQVEVVIKEEEVRRHNQVSDAWISFNGAVYDITKYVHRHPPCPGPGNCMIFTSTAGLSDISSFFCPWFRID